MRDQIRNILFAFFLFSGGFQLLYSQADVIADSIESKNSVKQSSSPDQVYRSLFDTIRFNSSKQKWINKLQNTVILPPQKVITDTLPTLRGELEFLQYEGLIIRNIRFVKVDVFGASILDTTTREDSWLAKRGNSVHIKTNTRILERLLLIKEGEMVDPRILADNVRIYRDLSYIEDAKIIVEPVPSQEGFADIIIVVKDQWSKAFYIELSEINAGRLELFDRNIFGTGNEIQNNIHWNPEKSSTWGYEAIYNNRNIFGSFIDGRFQYSNVFDNEAYGLNFSRKFYTPNTKYAGGASAFHQSSIKNIWSPDSGYFQNRISSNITDVWIGRAIKLNKRAGIDINRKNLILATRIYKENYFDRPETSRNLYYIFQDKIVWLNTFALSSQSFYQSNLIYSYGRTEDIPIGSLLNFTIGPEFGEFENRTYTSLSYARGDYITSLGYLYFKVQEGGFLTNKGNFEQAMFQLQIKFFSNLFIFGGFKYRQFINFDFTKGVKRFDDERISINDKYGLRGFSEPNVLGQQRFAMNMETVAFSPWYVYGFRFAFFGYIDFALLGPGTSNLIYEDVYTGLGIGTRIRNERLVFPTFSFRFGFYPNLQNFPAIDGMKFSGEPRLKPNNFYLTHPSMLDYQ